MLEQARLRARHRGSPPNRSCITVFQETMPATRPVVSEHDGLVRAALAEGRRAGVSNGSESGTVTAGRSRSASDAQRRAGQQPQREPASCDAADKAIQRAAIDRDAREGTLGEGV